MTQIEQIAKQTEANYLEQIIAEQTWREKLIRDGIPDLPGFNGEVRTATAEQMPMLLSRKLQEECDEVIAEALLDDLQALTEELADVYEVLLGIAHHYGIDFQQVTQAAEAKRSERGGFQNGTVLVNPLDK